MKDLNPKVLDKPAALERLGGDEQLYEEIVEVYRADMPEQLQRLTDGLKAEDRQLVQLQAHSIKSASANIGAEQMRAMAQRIEAVAMDDEMESLTQLTGDLQKKFEELLVYLDGGN